MSIMSQLRPIFSTPLMCVCYLIINYIHVLLSSFSCVSRFSVHLGMDSLLITVEVKPFFIYSLNFEYFWPGSCQIWVHHHCFHFVMWLRWSWLRAGSVFPALGLGSPLLAFISVALICAFGRNLKAIHILCGVSFSYNLSIYLIVRLPKPKECFRHLRGLVTGDPRQRVFVRLQSVSSCFY